MVRTMSLLRAAMRTARMIRHTPRLSDGLVPDDAVLLDAPDARLGPALVAAADGAFGQVAALLATTRNSAEWETRDRYVLRLAAFARNRDDWLADWLRAAPRDADALLVKAQLAVDRAWESPARAERLRELGPLIDAAALAAPGDPVPWRLALDHARGTHASHSAFEALWEQALRRSPHHYGCHVAALTYLSAQWYGSHRECFAFAEDAALDALPGSLVRALPVRAAFAQLMTGRVASSVQADRVEAAADLAIELSADYAPGDPWPAEVRNLLAHVLVARGRWADALEQFRRIGPYAASFPWAAVAEDPLGQFLRVRDAVRIEVACGMPLRGVRRRPAGHYA